MHRLTHFQHEIVGEVGEEVYSAHSAVEKADAHVHGADGSGDVLYLEAGIALTKRILDLYVNLCKLVVGV